MKEFLSQTGGRHLYGADLKNLQELALSMQEIFKDCGGNFVISGCKCTSYRKDNMTGNYPEGYVFIDGKIRHVKAKDNIPFNNLKIVAKERSGNSIPYADGSYHPQYIEYYAEYENIESVDVPCIEAGANVVPRRFPSLSSYLAHYAIVKDNEFVDNGTQSIDSSLDVRGQLYGNSIKSGGDVVVNNGKLKVYSDDNGITLEQANEVSVRFGNDHVIYYKYGKDSEWLNLFDVYSTLGLLPHFTQAQIDRLYVKKIIDNGDGEYGSFAPVPIGGIITFAGEKSLSSDNFILCDGRIVSKRNYPELYDILGDIYNTAVNSSGERFSAPGADYFRVPDLRGRFIVGYAPNQADYNAMGNVGGEKTHTLSVSEMPTHEHSLETDDLFVADAYDSKNEQVRVSLNKNYSSPAKASGNNWDDGIFIPPKPGDVGYDTLVGGSTFSGDIIQKRIRTENAGSSRPHENRPPYYTLAYIIRAK